MCKLYADWSPRRSSSTLNRSHSFSGGDTSHEKDAEKEGSFFENSTKEQSEVVGEETTEKISPPQRKGSFRLFRSNSWTTAKRNKKTEVKITSPTTTTTTIENQRCSPSYSTKSQDSGFSENAAAPTANNNNNTGTSSNTAQSIQNQRLQFLRLVLTYLTYIKGIIAVLV